MLFPTLTWYFKLALVPQEQTLEYHGVPLSNRFHLLKHYIFSHLPS